MELWQYPHPQDDTGIGVHWSAGVDAKAVGLPKIREYWIPELKAMGVKWVKMLHLGGQDLAELFLAHDIMPVVRLFRRQPNSTDPQKGTLGPYELEALRQFVRLGVRYFEFNNEPNLASEWQPGEKPTDDDVAQRMVAQNAAHDMETILAERGMPGLPAPSVGCRWDLIGQIVRLNRRDLLAGAVWIAVHNYDLNHPLDYPDDPVHQEGRLLTRAEYDALGSDSWTGPRYGHRSLEFVNEQRQSGQRPGQTLLEDPSTWRAYETADALCRQHLGRSLPVLSTENGPLVGEDPDPRYPTTTPEGQRQKALEQCRIMMGTSTQFPVAPPWYFCAAFWLLGNERLGAGASPWEGHAWYSGLWPGERLPVVDGLKAEPKRVRPPIPRGWPDGTVTVQGRFRGGQGQQLILRSGSDSWETRVGMDQRFSFHQVPPGLYLLTVARWPGSVEVRVEAGLADRVLEFDLDGSALRKERAAILGRVTHGAGKRVRLERPADGWTLETVVDEQGVFIFSGLPPGRYRVGLPEVDAPAQVVHLNEGDQVRLEFDAPEPPSTVWAWRTEDGGASPGFGVVRVEVPDQAGMAVRIWTDGWEGASQLVGSKPEYGPFALEFAPLGAGDYVVTPQGLASEAAITVDPARVLWVRFYQTTVEPWTWEARRIALSPGFGIVRVEVEGRDRYAVRLWTRGWSGMVRRVTPSAEPPLEGGEGHWAEFAPLGSGDYFVEPVGLGVQARVRVDGGHVIEVRFRRKPTGVPSPNEGVEHYLFLGQMPTGWEDFEAVVRYAARFGPAVGADIAQASRARHVTLLEQDASSEIEAKLEEAGCQIHRVREPYAPKLNQLWNQGRPY